MTSKISFYKLCKEDLCRRIWMLALSALGSFLALPVSFLITSKEYTYRLERMTDRELIPSILRRDYLTFLTSQGLLTEGCVLFLGALIVGIFGFCFLFSKKHTDLYHALPVKRERFFLVVWLNGLLIWLVPMVLSMLLTMLFMLPGLFTYGSISYLGELVGAACMVMLLYLCAFLLVYHFAILCVMLCGNLLNTFSLLALLGTLSGTLYGLIYLCSEQFLRNFSRLPFSFTKITWLSPLVQAPELLLAAGNKLENIFLPTGAERYLYTDQGALDTASFLFLLSSALFMLCLFWIAALLLYKRRPSELAENGVHYSIMGHFLRIYAGIVGGVIGFMLFRLIVDDTDYGWMIFGMLLCGILSFGAVNMILLMNFRAFFSHRIEMFVSLSLCSMALLFFVKDLSGFAKRLPDKEAITGMHFSLSYEDQYTNTQSRDAYLDTDINRIYPLLSALVKPDRDLSGSTMSFPVTVYLKNGQRFYRNYILTMAEMEYIRSLVENESYKETFYPMASGLLGLPDSLYASPANQNEEDSYVQILDPSAIQEISEAYFADFNDHFSLEELDSSIYVTTLELTYSSWETNASGNHADFSVRRYSLSVPDTYERTLKALRKVDPSLAPATEKLSILSLFPGSYTQAIESLDGYYSYFCLEGYPDYDTYLGSLYQAESSTITQDGVSSQQVSQAVADTNVYSSQKESISSDKLTNILPLVTLGARRYGPFSQLTSDSVYLGSIYCTDGTLYDAYVRKGALSKAQIVDVFSDILKQSDDITP
jgi:hypothetical protein